MIGVGRLRAWLRRALGIAPPVAAPFPRLGWTTPEREDMLWIALEYLGASRLSGDYAEFGVWRGDTFATALRYAELVAQRYDALAPMRFHAFDSFEGFPELRGDDVHPQFQAGGRAFPVDAFRARLGERGIDLTRTTATEGWFDRTLAPGGPGTRVLGNGSVALAYVDCDLYESSRDVLAYLEPRMLPGGLVLFDDWYCFAGHPWKGEQRACRELLARHPELVLVPFRAFGWHGRSFVWQRVDPALRPVIGGIPF